jgi:rRNA-processing protein FCF1
MEIVNIMINNNVYREINMIKNKKDKGTFIRLSIVELEMLKILKEKHYINISAMIRDFIKETYKKYENKF